MAFAAFPRKTQTVPASKINIVETVLISAAGDGTKRSS
jgi:hypothetical protein